MCTYLRAMLTLRHRSERGASAVEYAMLVAMVGVMILTIWGFQEVLRLVFEDSLPDDPTKVP